MQLRFWQEDVSQDVVVMSLNPGLWEAVCYANTSFTLPRFNKLLETAVAHSDFTKFLRWPLVSDKWTQSWVVQLGGVKGMRVGCGYDSDILLKSRIMAEELVCWLCLILRLHEARLSTTNAIGGIPEKFMNLRTKHNAQSID